MLSTRPRLGLLLLLAAGLAHADTIHVPGDVPDLQTAVDGAAPGDVIVLAKGDHGPADVVGKTSLEIRGKPGARIVAPGEEALFVSQSHDVEVRDLAFGAATICILLDQSTAVQVRDCRFVDAAAAPGIGIRSVDTIAVVVRDCRFEVLQHGIHVVSGTGVSIEKCKLLGGDRGITLGGTGHSVRKCKAKDQEIVGIDAAGLHGSVLDCVVRGQLRAAGEGNVLQDNDVVGGGIDVAGTGHHVVGNRVEDAALGEAPFPSLRLAAATACRVERNVVVDPLGAGIQLDAASTANVLLRNKVKRSDVPAYAFEGGGNAVVRNVAAKCVIDVTDPTGANVYLDNSFAEPWTAAWRVTKPAGSGIHVDGESASNTPFENRVVKCKLTAFLLEGTDDDLVRNKAKKCATDVQDAMGGNSYLENSFEAP